MPRYFVSLPTEDELLSSAFTLFDSPGKAPYKSKIMPKLMVAEMDDTTANAMREGGARVYPDIEFSTLPGDTPRARYWEPEPQPATPSDQAPGLPQVLDQIKAPQAWQRTRGQGATIAVIDTGICGDLKELPAARRSPVDLDSAYAGNHWSDSQGHGSMCATIAAGSSSQGGRFDGVAPDATILSARSTLLSTDIFEIYDGLISAKLEGQIEGPLVISNSYGLYVCGPPAGLPEDHPYLEMILSAVDHDIVVVFAAGNNHHDVLCMHDPESCGPNTIWGANSHDRVISVGTVNRNESNRDPSTPHCNSSRGPGQWAVEHPKPDCVAPTYGQVVWGCGYRDMRWWGTSGACPQVAGLAALLLSLDEALTPSDVAEIIRRTCRDIGAAPTCVGSGIIDCEAALNEI